MFSIRDQVQKIWAARQSFSKVLLAFAVFLLMVLSSIFFMNRTLSDKLVENVDSAVTEMQVSISNILMWQETPLESISNIIRTMLLDGESFESVQSFMTRCSTPEFKDRMRIFSYYSVYGYFNVFESFYDGGGWTPAEADNYEPTKRSWYTAGVAGGGQIVFVPPYIDMDSQAVVVAYARQLFDNNGRPLGVVALDVPLEYIKSLVVNRHITKGGYGYLLDENLIVIAHPNEQFLGLPMRDMYEGFGELANIIEQGGNISSHRYKNYQGLKTIFYSRQLDNGWYVGIVIPETEYFSGMYTMTWIISLLGVLMASVLSVILVSIDKAKNKSDIENRQKSNFLATVSHEIRTPMNTIMGITEIELQEESLPKDTKEAFDRIYHSGNLLLQIINDLLDLSKIEAGKLEIMPVKYETASLIYDVIHLNKLRYNSKPVEFKLHVGENIPATLIGDELRIKQILNNLLSNAFKYTQKGEIEFSVTAEHSSGNGGNVTLILAVRDTGHGMTAEQVSKLFDKYSRFNTETNRATEGTGLGMNITHNLVRMMNGDVFVKSEPKKGSIFTVRLPQNCADSTDVLSRELVDNLQQFRFNGTAQMKKSQILREYMPYGSVLIVDDIEANIFVAKLLLKPYGMKIDSAMSGFEAINKIMNGSVYDIIFMDHMMPKMDGIETVKIIRDMGYKKPIVALTANAVAGQADMFLANDFDDFISKPIDMRVLNAVLNKYIRDKHPAGDESPPVNEEKEQIREADMPLNVSGLDTEKGLALFDGDTESYVSALRAYIANAPEIMDKLRIVTEENLPDYAVNVHGLKSISGWICAQDIQAKAANIEALAKAGDLPGVIGQNDWFLKDAETFIAGLRAGLEKWEPPAIP
ncbi:MAG: response regulator [Treponema sp.]|jgi:signal transduction histidine kinase/DNA-binding response OmpR family regulator|nr:response regulator [Treponema sp.]